MEQEIEAQEEDMPALGGLLLAECERVISALGEDGVRPLPAAELKKISEKVGKGSPFNPVLIGDVLLDWAGSDSVSLQDLKSIIPMHEVLMASYLNTLMGMGAKEIRRGMLIAAGNDKRLIESIEDDSIRSGIIAARLKTFGNYIERKLYALSLGVMAYQE